MRIEIKDIHFPIKRKRFSSFQENAIKALAKDIKEVGLLTPINLKKVGKNYYLIDGYSRIRTLQLLGIEEVEYFLINKIKYPRKIPKKKKK